MKQPGSWPKVVHEPPALQLIVEDQRDPRWRLAAPHACPPGLTVAVGPDESTPLTSQSLSPLAQLYGSISTFPTRRDATAAFAGAYRKIAGASAFSVSIASR